MNLNVAHSEPNSSELIRSSRSQRISYLWIMLAALMARTAVAFSTLSAHSAEWFYQQATELGCLAQSMVNGNGLSSPFGGSTGPSAFLAPGYPFLVSLLFRVFGSYSSSAAYVLISLQVLFGVMTVGLVLYIANRTFNHRTALLAGWVWALSPPLLWLPVIFWDTSFAILSLTGTFALAMRLARTQSFSLWTLSGFYCGVVVLENPSLVLTLAAIMFWAATQTKRRSSVAAPVFGLIVFLAVFLPWPIRNFRVLHAPILFRSNMGYELWQGNRFGSQGYFDATLHPNANLQEFGEYARLGDVRYMQEKSSVARAAIMADPARFLRLDVMRTLYFWTGKDKGEASGILLGYATLGSVLAFAGVGRLLMQRSPVAALYLIPLLVLPLPYYVTHPDFRFRMLLDPIAVILASSVANSLWQRITARKDARA